METLERALAQLRSGASRYRGYDDYYLGRHKLSFATDKFRNAFGSAFREFSCNLCGAVVDAIADRLEVTGFASADSTLASAANDVWEANGMAVRATQVHTEALKCGDGYLIVWPGPDGQPTLFPQQAAACTVGYSEETPGVIEWAARAWVAGKEVRLNLYLPDRIDKFVAKAEALPDKASAFKPLQDEPTLGNPWGMVPMFHFATSPGMSGFGRSELANLMAPQDAYNKTILDTLVGMEFVALPQRWATGIEVDIDPDTGKPKPTFVPGVDRIWATDNTDVKFGEFGTADVTQLLAVQTDWEMKIARLAGIPPHFIQVSTDPPSGAALQALETRFVKKARRLQATYGASWSQVMALACCMAGSNSPATLRTVWADPAPLSEKERAETVDIQVGAGLSKREAIRKMGYSDQEAERIMAEAQAERDTATPSLGNPFAGF